MHKISIKAYKRAKESGYVKSTKDGVFKAACDLVGTSKFHRVNGFTTNELQEFISDTNHPTLYLFPLRNLNWINKVPSSLVRMNLISYFKDRECLSKKKLEGKGRTKARSYKLVTEGRVLRSSKPVNKNKVIVDLQAKIKELEKVIGKCDRCCFRLVGK